MRGKTVSPRRWERADSLRGRRVDACGAQPIATFPSDNYARLPHKQPTRRAGTWQPRQPRAMRAEVPVRTGMRWSTKLGVGGVKRGRKRLLRQILSQIGIGG